MGWIFFIVAAVLAFSLAIGQSIDKKCRTSWDLEKPTTQQCVEYGYPVKTGGEE